MIKNEFDDCLGILILNSSATQNLNWCYSITLCNKTTESEAHNKLGYKSFVYYISIIYNHKSFVLVFY